MAKTNVYKKAASQAKKELEKEVIAEIKDLYKETLQAMEDKKSEIKDLEAELKALKADLHDLEDGRLDRIKRRQEKDKVAKRTSEIDVDELERKFPIIKQHYTPDWTYAPYKALPTTGDIHMPFMTTLGTTITNGLPEGRLTNSAMNSVAALYSKEDIADTYVVNTRYGEKSYYVG